MAQYGYCTAADIHNNKAINRSVRGKEVKGQRSQTYIKPS